MAALVALAATGSVILSAQPDGGDIGEVVPCASESSISRAAAPPTPDSAPTADRAEQVVRAAVASVEAMTGAGASTSYGIAVLDRGTGRITVGTDGATPFYSASVVKLLTVVAVLHRVDAAGLVLTPEQQTDLQRALSASDDGAMDALWADFGGPATVTEMIGLAGLRDTRVPGDPGEWESTLISARDVVAVYGYVLTSMTASSKDMIMAALTEAGDVGADGFDQAFGLLQPPRMPGVAAKQGWMVAGSRMYLHSTGVLGTDDRHLVALLSRQPAGLGYPAGRANVSSAAGHLLDTLAEPPAVGLRRQPAPPLLDQ